MMTKVITATQSSEILTLRKESASFLTFNINFTKANENQYKTVAYL